MLAGRPLAAADLLPEVVGERCVHARMEQAGCRACLDACPRAAWVLDEERLGIDSARCDGCGLCAPACPEGAVLERWRPVSLRVDGTGVAFAACAEAGAVGGEALIPCLHLLGVRRLLELHQRGIRRLVLLRGDCDACPRGGVARIGQAIAAANQLLRDRDQPALDAVVPPSPTVWVAELARARAGHRHQGLDRRSFLRRGLTAAAEGAADLAGRDAQGVPPFVPPGRLVPRTRAGGLSLHAPRIDGDRCIGCDACARLCPHEVIRIEPEGYHLDPDGCTGCGVCVDACDRDAVRVEHLAPRPQTLLPLTARRCRACGAEFHLPATQAPSTLCPVCAGAGHHRRLFQVLE